MLQTFGALGTVVVGAHRVWPLLFRRFARGAASLAVTMATRCRDRAPQKSRDRVAGFELAELTNRPDVQVEAAFHLYVAESSL
jgi:hypothetical protein